MYSNELQLIPNTMPYAMSLKEKPRAIGITTGVVIGNSEDINSERNTIVVDEYGRVRVQFASSVVQGRYDKEVFSGKYSYTHSCYLRYTSPIASNHSGFISIPRVGDEVVVSFIDGDPDKPIITGSLYNQESPSLLQKEILSNKHKTSLSSKTLGVNELGSNEFTMSNLPNREEIYIKAEKDYKELVQHDYEQTILNDKTSKVTGSYTENILQGHIQNVAGLKDVNVGGEYLTVVGISKDTVVGLSNTLNVGAENTLRVAGDSKEYVGGDKVVEVEGDNLINIIGEVERTVNGNIEDIVLGSIDISSEAGINISSNSHYNLTSEKDMDIYSNNNTTINASKHMILKSLTTDIQCDELSINSSKLLSFKISDKFEIMIGEKASIRSDGSNIIFKLDKMEVKLDSNGFTIEKGNLNIKK